MGHTILVAIDRVPIEPAGRDITALSPSDSSNSDGDIAGLDEVDVNDPSEPVDVALSNEGHRMTTASKDVPGSRTYSGGTGEDRSAGAVAGGGEGNDISIDSACSVGEEDDVDAAGGLADVDNSPAGEPRPVDDHEANDVEESAPDMTEEDDVAVDGYGDPDSGIENVPTTREPKGA